MDCPVRNIHIEADHGTVIMRKRKIEASGMGQPAIHFQIARFHIGIGIIGRFVFQASLPAVIDAKHIASRLVAGIVVTHMEVVIGQHHTRKNLIQRNGSLTGFIAELKYAAPVAGRKGDRVCAVHCQLFHTEHLLPFTES